MRTGQAALVLVVTAVLAARSPVEALKAMPRPFIPDSSLQLYDSLPPPPVTLRVDAVRRGTGPLALNDSVSAQDAEGDQASIVFTVSGVGKVSHKCEIGFRYHLVDGTLPMALGSLPAGTWCPSGATDNGGATAEVRWREGRSSSHDPFCFRMYVTAVDSAGNESPPSNTVAVWHDGNQDIDKARLMMGNQFAERASALREIVGDWRGSDREGKGVTLTIDYSSFVLVTSDTLRGSLNLEFSDVASRTGLLDLSPFNRLHECSSRHGIFQREGALLRVSLGAPGVARPRDFTVRHPGVYAYEFRRAE